jgi:formylglycine-generating enzyme required for sulfatase activity
MQRAVFNVPGQTLPSGLVRRISLLLLSCLVWLVPAPLRAQPFDLARVRRSVVRVIANRGQSIGSGSILTVAGNTAYVLTAYHVIKEDVENDVSRVQVELFTEEVLEARISRRRIDTVNDLAVLTVPQLPSPPPPAIPWGRSAAVRETQRVFALGHPLGGPGWAVTDGTVSRRLGGFIYFSGTAVSPGNSGGPLLDAGGTVVGMITTLAGRLGIALTEEAIRAHIRGWVPAWPPSGQQAGRQEPQTPPPTPPVEPKEPAQVIRGQDEKEMRLVPAGWFEMGSTDSEVENTYQLAKKYYEAAQKSWFKAEQPVHRVWVEAFYMDTYEVTMREYAAFRQATGHRALPAEVADYAPGEKHPVVGVSWDDAVAYCRWAGKALPTEAQWEKAARGTDRRLYPWGNEPVTGRRANYCDARCEFEWKDTNADDGYRFTAPVGSYPAGASPYGLQDLAGNVPEWVQDWYDPDYYRRSPERNPVNTTPTEFRVLRGGGWLDPPAGLRAANRGGVAPDDRGTNVGFRCVLGVSASRP